MKRTPSRVVALSLARSRAWQLLMTGRKQPSAFRSRSASLCRSCGAVAVF